MTTRDDDRIAFLAGEPAESLSPRERSRLDELRVALQAPATWAEPDSALEDRVVGAIVQEAGQQPLDRPAPKPARRSRLAFRRRIYAFGAAVAAAAAIIIVIAVEQTSPAQLRFAMVVSGTTLAPDAHGAATLTKTGSGWRIQLSATGLPHLTGERYYEAWLKNAAGILVPVGTFNDGRHVTLWSGVPATTFRTLTVTQQQAGGNASSSGKVVLTGTIRRAR